VAHCVHDLLQYLAMLLFKHHGVQYSHLGLSHLNFKPPPPTTNGLKRRL
jgi:hypothetical protein